MHIKQFISLLLCVITIRATALVQSSGVKNAWVFAKEMTYGKEMRDLNGQPVHRQDTVYFIYLETSSKQVPKITAASFAGRSFSAAVHPVQESKIAVGNAKASGKKIFATHSASTSLWRIELVSDDLKRKIPTDSKMLLKGKAGTKAFNISKVPLMLESDIMG